MARKMTKARFKSKVSQLVFYATLGLLTVLPGCCEGTIEGSVNETSLNTCYVEGGSRYIDTAPLSCASCGPHQTAIDIERCGCSEGYQLDQSSAPNTISCVQCISPQASTPDGLACLPCGVNASRTSSGACLCNDATHALIYQDLSGQYTTDQYCAPCASGYHVDDVDPTRCIMCPSLMMQRSGGDPCACPTGYSKIDGSCVSVSLLSTYIPSASAYVVEFSDIGINVDSQLFKSHLSHAYVQCSQRNTSACHVLAHLCIMQEYRDGADACLLYRSIIANNSDWENFMPILFYESDPTSSTDISFKGSFAENKQGSVLSYKIATYSFDGSLLSLSPLTYQLQLCRTPENIASTFLFFGSYYDNECTLRLDGDELLSEAPLHFYQIYFEDINSVLVPVPVHIASGSYVHRFQLYDNTSGFSYTSNSLEAIRVASHVALSVTIRDTSSVGYIFPPVVSLGFSSRNSLSSQIKVAFKSRYAMDVTVHTDKLKIVVVITAVLSGVISVVRVVSYSRKEGLTTASGALIIFGLVSLLGVFSTLLFWVLYGYCLYWLIFFKGQSSAYAILPIEGQHDWFEWMIVVAFVGKLIEVLHLIREQINVDIFFIDWEKPKDTSAMTFPVSMWRTVLVANEWNEIQTHRKLNGTFLLVAVLFFWYVADAQNVPSRSPSSVHDYDARDHYLLRFGMTASIFLSVGMTMWVIHTFIVRRFIEDKMAQFADLCSIANVSVFILDRRLSGYYIHGRSVHGTADVDMWEMRMQLKKEAEDLTGKRGLLPENDRQTFEIFVSPRFRSLWDDVYRFVIEKEPNGPRGVAPLPNRGQVNLVDKSLEAYDTLNRYLQIFLDHARADLEYSVQDRLVLHAILDLAPEISGRGYFFNDDGNSFSKALFYGHELTLFLFTILLFGIVDYSSSNFVAGAITCYSVFLILKFIRDDGGRKNIGRKTLIDNRFLI